MRKSLLLASLVVISTSTLGMFGNGKRRFPYDSSEDKHQTQKIRILAPKEISIGGSNCKQEEKQSQASQSSSQYEWDPAEQDMQLESLICREKKLDIRNNTLEILRRYNCFPNLRILNLASIKISSENLSSLLLNAKNLEELYLNNNELDTFPSEICELKNLKILSLRDNQLHSLPKEIIQLTNLQELYLSGNKLKVLPKELWDTKNSMVLTVYNNPINLVPKSKKNLKIFNEREDEVWRNPNKFLDNLNENRAVFTQNDIKKELKKRKFNKNNIEVIFDKVFDTAIYVGENIKEEWVYTGEKYQQLETEVIELFQKIAKQTSSIQCPKAVVDSILNKYNKLSYEQKNAVKILTDNQNLAILIGKAGAGKTTTMKAVAEVYELSKANIIGMSLSALASENLGKEANIKSGTIASWKWKRLLGNLNNIDVVIVDEASMIGTRDWYDVFKLAEEMQAKIIAIGDDNQLKPISSGDCFRMALDNLNNFGRLEEIRRQTKDWQKKASIEFSNLNTAEALSIYERYGKIHILTDMNSIAKRFLELEKQGSAVILCVTHKEREELNKLIHCIKVKQGTLGEEIIKIGGKIFSLKEQIMFTKNNKAFNTKNGEIATIERFENGILTVKSGSSSKTIDLKALTDPKSECYNKIDYAYAITVTKSQGKTYDNTLVIAGKMMDAKSIYVAMTRHRENVDLYYKTSDFKNVRRLISRLSRYEQKDLVHDYLIGSNPYKSRVQEYVKLIQKEHSVKNDIYKNLKDNNEKNMAWKIYNALQAKRFRIGEKISKDYKNHELYMNQSGLTLEKLEIDCKLRNKP